jgi:phytanoyl-CoA hydroxylase
MQAAPIDRRVCSVLRHLSPAATGNIDHQPGQQLSVTRPDGYIFTDNNSVLSKAQRDFYEANGFLVVRNNVPLDDITRWTNHFQRLCTGELAFAKGTQVVRDVGFIRQGRKEKSEETINKITNLEADDVLMSYCSHPDVVSMLEAILGKSGAKTIPFTPMVVNKPPDVGLGSSRHPVHQDLFYMPIRPASKIVCAWTAMDRCTRENGCLFVHPGSHTGPLVPHDRPETGVVNPGFIGLKGECDESDELQADVVWLEMEPGDTVFFHPILHHGSGRNSSAGYRKAISAHFASTECVYFDTQSDPVQRERAKRLQQTQSRRAQKDAYQGSSHVELYRRRFEQMPAVFGSGLGRRDTI